MCHYAHSSNRKGSPWELLHEHISLVAKRAASNATAFGAEREARIAGLLHDLGKYGKLFKRRLENKESGLDHWSAGMIATLAHYRTKAFASAIAIQGHHVGLQEGLGETIQHIIRDLSEPPSLPSHPRLTEPDVQISDLLVLHKHAQALLARLEQDGLHLPEAPACSIYDMTDKHFVAAMLDARMLFSALVDADYIETEAHFEGLADGTKVYRPEGPALDAARLRSILRNCIAQKERETGASENVRTLRALLWGECSRAADEPQSLFTLTAPTGSGKTLAMLEFALCHAESHSNIRRIVVVVPFLTIIEQTAKIYRELFAPTFGQHYVIEHHSLSDGVVPNGQGIKPNADADNENEARRMTGLLTENWNAPIILTTSVQFFESLFANRPAKCRKLHRLANSVILFDEAQTLPPRLAVPTLAALSRLTERYGCSVVFSTATQPAFDHLNTPGGVLKYAAQGWAPTSIADAPTQIKMFNLARRVKIQWRIVEPLPWETIAEELADRQNEQALCVVNLKRHAQKLAGLLKEKRGEDELLHLSTNMCPAHRERALAKARTRLDPAHPRPCCLVATQCIEAGVDLSAPVAYRAFGPLDAIAQVAGRCNREGQQVEPGRMIVFMPEKCDGEIGIYPPGYQEAADTTKTLLEAKRNEAKRLGVPFEDLMDIYDPNLFNEYYRLLYDLTGVARPSDENDENTLENALARRSFIDVAARYRLINQKTVNIVVPYEPEMALFEALKVQLENGGHLTREWIREARPITINAFLKKNDPMQNFFGSVQLGRGAVAEDWFLYLNPSHYDPLLGLVPPDASEAWNI